MNEETLFELARNTPQCERAALLDQHCAGNPALRARVDALFAIAADATQHSPHDSLPHSKHDVTATFCDSTATKTHQLPTTDPETGTMLAGKYRLTELIGEGGMGSVWMAQQSEPVKRKVAVKLIKAGMDSKAVLARFEAERQALAVMDHPNIAKVLDGGLHAGRPFFVMELVNGVPITDYCDANKLTPKQRLELFVPVCAAIQHAHQKGIIHRDIKPSNVIVAIYDDKPVPKVIDFGIAKATGGALTEHTIETAFGGVVGTPQYMSPEQASLNNMDIDTRSDVYSLGVLLYELLTGSPPFSRKELEKKGLLEILRMVREEEPPRPSTKLTTEDTLPSLSANRSTEPKKLTGLLRNELDWIVMKALEKDRTRRYETANGFAADVNRYLSGEAVQAHPPSTAYRIKKFVKRNQGQVIAAGLVFLALVAGGVGTSIGMARARQANTDLAAKNEALEAERLKVEQRFDMARKAIAAFHTTIDEQPELGNEAFRPLRKKLLGAAAGFYRELETLLANETDAKSRAALADGYFQLAELTNKIGDEREALAVFRKALAIRRELAAAPGADADARLAVSVTLLRVGILMATTGDTTGALRALEEVHDLVSVLEAEAPTDAVRQALAGSHQSLGWVLEPMGKPAEALVAYRKGLAIRQKLADAHPAVPDYQNRLATSHNSIGLVLRDVGKLAEALVANEQALAIRQKLADAHPTVPEYWADLSGSHNNIGNLLRRMDKPAEALAAHRKALAIRQKLADAHPAVTEYQSDLAQSHDNVGNRLRQAGKPAEALAAHMEALAIRQKLADAHPTVTQFRSELADSHHNIGIHLDRTGRPAEALAAFEKARDARQKLADAQPTETWFQRDLASSHNSIGIVLDRTGKPGDALAAFEKARDLRQKLADAQPTDTKHQIDLASSHDDIGKFLSRTWKPGEALASYQKARDIRQKLVNAHPGDSRYRIDLASTHNTVGRLLAKEGRFAEAFAALDAGLAIREKLVAADTKSTKYISGLGYSHAYRGWARVRAGQSKEAAADLRKALELWETTKDPDAEDRFEKSRALALLAKLGADPKSGVTADEAKSFADRAATALADAVKAGWAQPTELREPDFDAVRGREDFKKILADLENATVQPPEKK